MQVGKGRAWPEGSRAGAEDGALDEGIRRWVEAQRWRRRMGRALLPLKLTLAEWLVLDASDQLICESEDAVSQIQVGKRLELSKATLSRVMNRLERRGLVDQAPQFGGTAYRIYLSERGKSAARAGRERLDVLCDAWL